MANDRDISVFGQIHGRDVHRIALRSDCGLVAHVLTWGAVLQDLSVPLAAGGSVGVVLGFDTFAAYPDHSPYFGATIGRYANRIGGGRYDLDGRTHWLDRNERARTTLHGGAGGFSRRIWDVMGGDAASVTLGLVSEDGDQGFAGRVIATCRYSLVAGALVIDYTAQTDAPTPVNMTHHSYFNLDGGADLSHHMLRVNADSYTPVDSDKIALGTTLPVAGTPFDLRKGAAVMGRGLDHNFCLNPGTEPGYAAQLWSTASGLRMRVETTKPGLQVYDGHMLAVTVPGHGGVTYAPCAGLCLEPQFFPDSPNQPGFPDCILRPGTTYRHQIAYRFDQI